MIGKILEFLDLYTSQKFYIFEKNYRKRAVDYRLGM